MRKPVSSLLVLLLVAVPFVVGIVAVVYAADLCLGIGFPSGGGVGAMVVVKDVGGGAQGKSMNNELAKRNKCEQFSGFTSNQDLGVATSGQRTIPGGLFGNVSLCSNSDATHLTVISNFLGRSIQTQIPFPILAPNPTEGSSNALSDVLDDFAVSGTGVPTTAAVCSPPSVPVS